jgi:hypothetical protein
MMGLKTENEGWEIKEDWSLWSHPARISARRSGTLSKQERDNSCFSPPPNANNSLLFRMDKTISDLDSDFASE